MTIFETNPKLCRRGRSAGAIALTILACVSAGCANPQESGRTTRLSIATGGTGGVYYPYGGGISKVISDRLDGVEATAEVTAGTVDNLKFLASRSADLAFGLVLIILSVIKPLLILSALIPLDLIP